MAGDFSDDAVAYTASRMLVRLRVVLAEANCRIRFVDQSHRANPEWEESPRLMLKWVTSTSVRAPVTFQTGRRLRRWSNPPTAVATLSPAVWWRTTFQS